MFLWRRPADMPLEEPSEEDIWKHIDRRDPEGRAEIRHRLQQHREMLEGRDIYNGFFTRTPSLIEIEARALEYKEPVNWISTIHLKFGEYNPVYKRVEDLSSGHCEVLMPASDEMITKTQVNLLSHRQLVVSSTTEWPRNSSIGRVSSPPPGYVAWAQYILQVHRDTLRTVGIYDAVYASMFNYNKLPFAWARGVMEFWDAKRNTCWIGPEELTVTLQDMKTISGLPILGSRYEEYIPVDEELFSRKSTADRNPRGETVFPRVYPWLLSHYKHAWGGVHTGSTMTMKTWIKSFIKKDFIFEYSASIKDPFNLGLPFEEILSEGTAEPLMSEKTIPVALPEINEELLLAGFLVTWLCYFVIPVQENIIRPEVLLPASRLSGGTRLAIAPAVLAKLYEALRTTSKSDLSALHSCVAPWQYLQAWVNLHVEGAFTSVEYPLYFSDRGYPTVMQLSQASAITERKKIRLFFFNPFAVVGDFKLVHHLPVTDLPSELIDTDIDDGRDERGRCSILYQRHAIKLAEHLVGIRPAYLFHRIGNQITVEGYQPNRVAKQFGYSQATALDGLPSIPGVGDAVNMNKLTIEAKLYVAAASWSHLVRLGTQSKFKIAPPNNHEGVSFRRLKWVQLSMAPSLSHGAQVQKLSLKSRGKSQEHQDTRKDKSDKAKRGRGSRDNESSSAPQENTRTTLRDEPPHNKRTRREVAAKKSLDPLAHESSASKRIPPVCQDPTHNNQNPQVDEEGDNYADISMDEVPTGYTPVASSSPPRETTHTSPTSKAPLQEDVRARKTTSPSGSRVSGCDMSLENSLTEQFEDDEDEATAEHHDEVPNDEQIAVSDDGVVRVKIEIASPLREAEVMPNNVDTGTEPSGVRTPEQGTGHIGFENNEAETSNINLPEQTEEPVKSANNEAGPSGINPPEQDTEPEMIGEELFQSEIITREPIVLKQPDVEIQKSIMSILQRFILNLNLLKVDTLQNFVAQADNMLRCLASCGVDEETQQIWEGRCRQAEFLIQRSLKFRTVKVGMTLMEVRRIIDQRKGDIDMAQTELSKQEANIKHLQEKGTESAEIEQNTADLKEHWEKIVELLSQRKRLEAQQAGRTKLLICEQNRSESYRQIIKMAEGDLELRIRDERVMRAEAKALEYVGDQLNKLKLQTTF